MSRYEDISVRKGDGLMLLEGDEEQQGLVKLSKYGNAVPVSQESISNAFRNISKGLRAMLFELRDAGPDEVEITLGLKASSETEALIVTKGTEHANYSVTLKWRGERL